MILDEIRQSNGIKPQKNPLFSWFIVSFFKSFYTLYLKHKNIPSAQPSSTFYLKQSLMIVSSHCHTWHRQGCIWISSGLNMEKCHCQIHEYIRLHSILPNISSSGPRVSGYGHSDLWTHCIVLCIIKWIALYRDEKMKQTKTWFIFG